VNNKKFPLKNRCCTPPSNEINFERENIGTRRENERSAVYSGLSCRGGHSPRTDHFFSFLTRLHPGGKKEKERERDRERERDGRGGGGELAPGERSPVKAFALKLCNLGRKFAFELLGKPRAAV